MREGIKLSFRRLGESMEQGMVIQSSGIFKGLTKILITVNIKSAWLVVYLLPVSAARVQMLQ